MMAVGAISAWEPGDPLADAMLDACILLEEDSVYGTFQLPDRPHLLLEVDFNRALGRCFYYITIDLHSELAYDCACTHQVSPDRDAAYVTYTKRCPAHHPGRFRSLSDTAAVILSSPSIGGYNVQRTTHNAH